MQKNKEGYPDPTAGIAIQKADRPPKKVAETIHTLHAVAELAGLELRGRVWLRDKKSGKEYR